ncbi:MAG TPA: hypothetical protein VHC48_13035 [Puia sp.]|nr:hypothetical protein [Puia sp.]
MIVLNMRTAEGFVRFGQFELGMDRASVEALYETLEGQEPEGEEGFLHIDLVEMRQGLPVSLRVLSCSAAELARNVCAITRQVFRWKNLDESMPEDE